MSELLRRVLGRVLRAEAGEGGEQGGGGAAPDGAVAPGGGEAGAGDGGAKPEPSLLESVGKAGDAPLPKGEAPADETGKPPGGEQKSLQAAEKDTRRPKDVPAKFWDAEKGEIKLEAWSKSTAELETRMRTIGLPPKTADEYKFEMPKEFKEAGMPDLDAERSNAFKARALEAGLTQKQYEFVMGEYFRNVTGLAEQTAQFSASRAHSELMAYYKTPEELTKNVRAAYQVFSAFADERDMAQIDQIGNIPAVIRVLAKIRPEMEEDHAIQVADTMSAESLEHLMRGGPNQEDSPYWNPSHPQHKATLAKVTRHHEAVAAAKRRKAA